jgi:hypothetical protein
VDEVVALEQGEQVDGEAVARIAGVLRLNADVLVRLFGSAREVDSELLEAANEFIAELEASEPLQPSEVKALGRFRNAVKDR